MVESLCFGVLVVGLVLWMLYEMVCEYRRVLSDAQLEHGDRVGWMLIHGTLRKVSR